MSNLKNCAGCPDSDGLSYLTYSPLVKCTVTGKSHYPTDSCDVDDSIYIKDEDTDIYSELYPKEVRDKFKEVCQPVVDFLNKYGDPHCTVIITQTDAEMKSGEIGVSFEPKD